MPDRGEGNAPYRRNRFEVELEVAGEAIAGFSRVDLPDATVADVGYREGNDPARSQKLKAGNNEYEPLVFEKGVTDSTALYDWFKKVQDGKLDEARKTIAVNLLNSTGNAPVARWEFHDAWPGRYNGPDLDANAHGIAIETLEVLYNEMERVQ